MYFDACYREITVQCENPGEAVGRRGINLQEIRDQSGWLFQLSEPLLWFQKRSTTFVGTDTPTQKNEKIPQGFRT